MNALGTLPALILHSRILGFVLPTLLILQCGPTPGAMVDESSDVSAGCLDLPDTATCRVATDGKLNIRQEPSLTGAVVISATRGMSFIFADATQQADGHCWVRLKTNSGFGWASAAFLDCSSPQDRGRNRIVRDKSRIASGLGRGGAPNILYPGDPACSGPCEMAMQNRDIEIPSRNGQPWGNTYQLGHDEQRNLAAYSSGRIALLRRLGLRNNGKIAILIDPAWEDGNRDFFENGRPVSGASIVKKWLQSDSKRLFLLIYNPQSAGWQGYQQLGNDSQVGSRVKACRFPVSHLQIPSRLGPSPVLDPIGFVKSQCRK